MTFLQTHELGLAIPLLFIVSRVCETLVVGTWPRPAFKQVTQQEGKS